MTDLAELGLVIRSDGVVVAKDRLDKFTKSATVAEIATAKLISTAGKLIGAYATWQIGEAIIRKFVTATAESEARLRQLEVVVRSTGSAAGYTARQLADMAGALQKVTSFDDEAVESAQALLLTFTRIGHDVFPQALKSVLDISTAMGTDLKGSAVQIGKALNDPIQGLTALTRIGVAFDAQQKQQIKNFVESGQTAKAQAIILKELQKEFGDSATAARSTLGGALKALGGAFDNLFESTGPASENLRKSIEGLIGTISDPSFMASIQNFGATLFNAMSSVLPIIQKILDFLNQLGGISSTSSNGTTNKYLKTSDSDLASQLETYRKYRATGVNANGSMNQLITGKADPEIASIIQEQMARKRRGAYDDIGEGTGTFGSLTAQFGPAMKARSNNNIVTDDMIAKSEKLAKDYEKITRGANDQIVANQNLAASLGMTREEADRLTTSQDLMNKAANDNINLTPQQTDELNGLAAQMARTKEEATKLQEVYDFGKDALNGFFSDMKSNLQAGQNLWESLGNAATNVLNKIADKALSMAADGIWDLIFSGVKGALGGATGSAFTGGWGSSAFKNANGNAFPNGISGYSNSIVTKPTLFKFANGTGLMGEAGPEAVMPLVRGQNGKLGVAANNNGGGSATINFYLTMQGSSGDQSIDQAYYEKFMAGFRDSVRPIVVDVLGREMKAGGLLNQVA